MTHPTAGPDDRSPIADLFLAENFERWGVADRCSRTDAQTLTAYQYAVAAALRSARKDAAAMRDVADAVLALNPEEDMRLHVVSPHVGGVLMRLQELARKALASPLILEKNDRGK